MLGSYTAIRRFDFVILMLIIFNLPQGPDKEEALRFGQLQQAIEFYLNKMIPENSVLFQARAADMLSELGDLVEIVDGDRNRSLWAYLKSIAPYEKKRYRCKLAQWSEWQRRGIAFLSQWSVTRFKAELVGLEMDMITNASVVQPITIGKGALDVAAHTYSTDIGSMQPDTKALRSSCKHAVGVAISTLQFRAV